MLLRAGVIALAVAVMGAGIAEAKPKKKRNAARPAAARTVADNGVWKRGYADIVVDAKTGKVISASNADELRHPASITKVMTLYLLFEQIEARKLRLDSQLPVSSFAAAQQPSKLGVKAGTTISVEDAIKALVTRSANDCAVVIAEAISGSSSEFAVLMTRKARALGMSRTTFRNPHGLPHPDQVTTARDLAVLGRAIQERFPKQYGYFATRSFYYKGVAIRNHNRLLGRVEGVDGIKTGYTSASGFNLLTNVERDGRHIVAVVLGGRSGASRDAQMAKLLEAGLPRAFAGRKTVAPVAEAPGAGTDAFASVVASLPDEPRLPKPRPDFGGAQAAAAVASAPAPEAETPRVLMPPTAPARVAVASLAPVSTSDITTASIPAPTGRTAVPAPGSTAPIVPLSVKTVAVPRPAAPTAAMSNQPGTLGTLTFSGGQVAAATAAPPAPARTAPSKPAGVQLASTGPVALPQRAAAAAPAAPVAPSGGWAIQIGAYGSQADAKAQIAKAQAKVGAPLAKAAPYTEEGTKGANTFVRARFAGFNAEAAARDACKALKRNDFGCMVFRN